VPGALPAVFSRQPQSARSDSHGYDVLGGLDEPGRRETMPARAGAVPWGLAERALAGGRVRR